MKPPTVARTPPRLVGHAYFQTPEYLRGIITEVEVSLYSGLWTIAFHPYVRFDTQIRITELATEILLNVIGPEAITPDSHLDEQAEKRITTHLSKTDQKLATRKREIYSLAESEPFFLEDGEIDLVIRANKISDIIRYYQIHHQLRHFFVTVAQKHPIEKENWSYPVCL